MHRRAWRLLAALGALLSAGRAAGAEPLPFFDARDRTDRGRAAVRESLDAQRAGAAWATRVEAAERLRGRIPGLRIDDHALLGTAHYIGSTERFLTGPRAPGTWTPRGVVADFIRAEGALLEIDTAELERARVKREFVTRHNGVTHLTFQQQMEGADLLGCELRANVGANGELVNLSSTMLPRPAGGFVVRPVRLSASEAIAAAAANIGVALSAAPEPDEPETGASRRQAWRPGPDFRDDESIETQRVWFPMTREDIRPAWLVVLPEKGIGNTYEIVVDASDGEVLWRWNRLHFATTEPITMRVYTGDSPRPGSPGTEWPDGFQFPLVPRELVTILPAEVSPFSPNGWIDDGGNETLGNNVAAHRDGNGDNQPDLPRPQGAPYRVFDFALDPGQPPFTYHTAAVVQLFYLCNRFHDRLYALGFDEAAGNFQEDNFGRGGVGGDRLLADAQDGAVDNNATFLTAGWDGSAARVQMGIFRGPDPDRDSDLDADLVYHELGHGVSLRLLEGTVAGGQSAGMGEGWSDFLAIALNAQSDDDPDATYPLGAYSAYLLYGPDYVFNYYFGVRRFPYSTDLLKNPLTYADIDPEQQSHPPEVPRNPGVPGTADAVHNVGEAWCQALLECRAKLWAGQGFAANQSMLRLVVDGMKLSATNPNFVQGRDAILLADLLNSGGANHAALWEGFARRGLGASAIGPPGGTTRGVIEAFDSPGGPIGFLFPDGAPGLVGAGGETTFPVRIVPMGGVPEPDSGRLHWRIDDGPWTESAMAPTGENEYVATLPRVRCGSEVTYRVTVGRAGGGEAIDAAGFRFARPATRTMSAFADDFNVHRDWSVVNSPGLFDGAWVRGVPAGGGERGDPPADYDGSGFCFLTANRPGNSDVDGGTTTLVSPLLNLGGMNDPYVRYARWYFNQSGDDPRDDVFVVEVTNNNGLTWNTLEIVGPTGPECDGGWVLATFRIGATVVPSSTTRFRFAASDRGRGSVVEAAVDAFEVFDAACVTRSLSVGASDVLGPRFVRIEPADNDGLEGADAPFVARYPEEIGVSLTFEGTRFGWWVVDGEAQPAGQRTINVVMSSDREAFVQRTGLAPQTAVPRPAGAHDR